MKTVIKSLVLATAVFSTAASADLSYTYAEGGVAILMPSGQTLMGFDVRGSYLATENIFAYGGFRLLSDDYDYTNWHIGAGYRHPIDAKTDVWAGVNLEYQEFDLDCWIYSCSVDDTAPAIRGGLRHQLNEQIEVGASARYVTGDVDYLGLTGQGRYFIQKNLSATAEVDLQDGDFGLFGGVTFFF